MLSKNKIKYIHSLELKKNRKEEQAFLAEGYKLVEELLGHFPCRIVAGTKAWLDRHPHLHAEEIFEVASRKTRKKYWLSSSNPYMSGI